MEAEHDPRLVKGIHEFNQGLFFECHETLEEIWLEEHGEDREFYQGIIQVAAGFYKWEQGVLVGAIKLWRAGLQKLAGYPTVYLGVDLGSFIEGVEASLKKVEAAHQTGRDSPDLNIPPLSFIH